MVETLPLNRLFVPDFSKKWSCTLSARFYIYSLHSSGGHLVNLSMASAIYLAYLRCVTRDYGGACRVLDEWCRSDKALAPDERFWLSLIVAEAILPKGSVVRTIPVNFAAVLLRAVRLRITTGEQRRVGDGGGSKFSSAVTLAALKRIYLNNLADMSDTCRLAPEDTDVLELWVSIEPPAPVPENDE